jgi:hypothetical protein
LPPFAEGSFVLAEIAPAWCWRWAGCPFLRGEVDDVFRSPGFMNWVMLLLMQLARLTS